MISIKFLNSSFLKNQIKLCNCLYSTRTNLIKQQQNKQKIKYNHNCIVTTLGSFESGKTTLTEALRSVTSQKYNFKLDEPINSGSHNAVYNRYYIDDIQVVHVDVDSKPPKNILTSTYGADISIVVIDLLKGLDYQAKEHIIFLELHDIKNYIVYLNKSDLNNDKELIELTIDEVKSFFKKRNLNLDDNSIVYGSALNAINNKNELDKQSIDNILKLIELKCKNIDRNEQINRPALFTIKRSHTKLNKGTEVTGNIKQGIIKKGDIVNICGFDRLFKTKIVEIESFGEQLDCVKPGISAALLLKSIKRDDIDRGMIIVHPDHNIQLTDHFKAKVHCFNKDEQFNPYIMKSDDTFNLYTRTLNCRTIIRIENDKNELLQGEDGTIVFKLVKTMPLLKGMKFILRNVNTVAIGEITELLPSFEIEFLNKAKRN